MMKLQQTLDAVRDAVGEALQRRADAPLKPKAPQEPRHTLGGLFGDEHKQLDLIDELRRKP